MVCYVVFASLRSDLSQPSGLGKISQVYLHCCRDVFYSLLTGQKSQVYQLLNHFQNKLYYLNGKGESKNAL